MANKVVRLPVLNGLGQTLRKDNWWVGPLVTFIVLASFVVYATFRAFEGRFYAVGPYLSPLASPYFETKGLGHPARHAGDPHPARSPGSSASPVTTTGRRTTARSR